MVWCDVSVCVGEGATLLMLLGTSGGGWCDAACNPGWSGRPLLLWTSGQQPNGIIS